MASVPLAAGQLPVSAPQSPESGNSTASQISDINQSDKVSFPQAMKKAEGDSGGKQADGQAVPISVAAIHQGEDILPLSGMFLPLHLPYGAVQASAPSGNQTEMPTSGSQIPEDIASNLVMEPPSLNSGGKGDYGKGVRPTAVSVNNKELIMSDALHEQTGDVKSKSPLAPMADMQVQVNPKPDFSDALSPLQGNQFIARSLIHDMPLGPLDKPAVQLSESSHMNLDITSALGGMAQGNDKVNQTFTAPSAISVPLKAPEWGDELSNRIVWMVHHDIQTASIKINPPHLGPLEVQISMNKDHVDVSFNSHHVAVKDALDASIPKLREMLGSSGLQLGDANVTHHSFSGHQQYNSQDSSNQYFKDGENYSGMESTENDEMASTSLYGLSDGSGAIDFYA